MSRTPSKTHCDICRAAYTGCPMHRAAPALVAACEAAFERLTDNDMIARGSYPLTQQLSAALTLAKGE